MASSKNVVSGLGINLQILVLQGKSGFKVNIVTRTVVPRIFTKHVINDSMKKNCVAQWLEAQLRGVPAKWQDTGVLIRFSSIRKDVMKTYAYTALT